jgi:hypothetical protein
MRIVLACILGCLLISCSSEPKTVKPTAAPATQPVKPVDESRRFPSANLMDTRVVDREAGGKPFMPGGTVAKYRKGKSEYEMFVARAASPTHAAIALSDWRKSMTDARLVAAFGGYFGKDEGVPTFVFTKGQWIAGVKGLSEKDADVPARTLASRLD